MALTEYSNQEIFDMLTEYEQWEKTGFIPPGNLAYEHYDQIEQRTCVSSTDVLGFQKSFLREVAHRYRSNFQLQGWIPANQVTGLKVDPNYKLTNSENKWSTLCIVAVDNQITDSVTSTGRYEFTSSKWYWSEQDGMLHWLNKLITHYMPIPELPKV